MQFAIEDVKFILHGMVSGKVQLAIKKQLSKLSCGAKGPCTLIMTVASDKEESMQSENNKAILEDLYSLLEHY